MPRISGTLAAAGLLCAALLLAHQYRQQVAASPTPRAQPAVAATQDVRVFMQKKLKSCSAILEGLANDDFRGIQDGADELIAMSKRAMWQHQQTPGYVQDTADFVATVELLLRMAEAENAQAATLAYSQVIVRCADCHSHVRAPKLAMNLPHRAPTLTSDLHP